MSWLKITSHNECLWILPSLRVGRCWDLTLSTPHENQLSPPRYNTVFKKSYCFTVYFNVFFFMFIWVLRYNRFITIITGEKMNGKRTGGRPCKSFSEKFSNNWVLRRYALYSKRGFCRMKNRVNEYKWISSTKSTRNPFGF